MLHSLGVRHALVYRAIEGSDEAPLDGQSRMVILGDGAVTEVSVEPEDLGFSRAGRASISCISSEDQSARLLDILEGKSSAKESIRDLLLYNAALRLWIADMGVENASLGHHAERARAALDSGSAAGFLHELNRSRTPEGATA